MAKRALCGVAAGIFALGLLAPMQASAGVNCKFVLKNLSLPGRTVEGIAETMSISEDDIKACQEEAAQKAADAAAQATGQDDTNK